MQVTTSSPIDISSRGARFLHLVRQNKLNVSPQLTKKTSSPKFTLMKRSEVAEQKDYLKLSSSVKFNPDASPRSSILVKRKADAETPIPFESSPLSSSSSKRKRVGFRDPVSSTKEYLITEDEERMKSSSLIRCLAYEIENVEEQDVKPSVDAGEIKIEAQEVPLIALDSIEDLQQQSDISTTGCSEQSASDSKLVFTDRNGLLDYITKNLSIDELFEKLTQAEEKALKKKELVAKVINTIGINDLLSEYFAVNQSPAAKLSLEQNAFITGILREISNLMEKNRSVKHKVLAVMSEKHAEEFLDHSLLENSTNSVCDKIPMKNLVNYIVHKVSLSESGEHDELISDMNSQLIRHLVDNTQKDGKEVFTDEKEIHRLMELLYKNKPKIEIFDSVQEFLRNLVNQPCTKLNA